MVLSSNYLVYDFNAKRFQNFRIIDSSRNLITFFWMENFGFFIILVSFGNLTHYPNIGCCIDTEETLIIQSFQRIVVVFIVNDLL